MEEQRAPMEEIMFQFFDLLDHVVQANGQDTIWYDDEETAHEALVDLARIYTPGIVDDFIRRLEYNLSVRDDLPVVGE